MNHLQGIVLLVGFVTLTIDAATSAMTSEEVASVSVAYYNRRFAPSNAFKLLQIVAKKEQNLQQVTTYFLRLRMKETTCSTELGITEIANCDFKNDGVTMVCTLRVIVSHKPNSEPRLLSMKCVPAASRIYQEINSDVDYEAIKCTVPGNGRAEAACCKYHIFTVQPRFHPGEEPVIARLMMLNSSETIHSTISTLPEA